MVIERSAVTERVKSGFEAWESLFEEEISFQLPLKVWAGLDLSKLAYVPVDMGVKCQAIIKGRSKL